MNRIFHISSIVAIISLFPVITSGQTLEHADSLVALGESNQRKGDYPQAELYYEKALQIYQGLQDSTEWCDLALDYSELLIDQAKYDQAMDLLLGFQRISDRKLDTGQRARIANDIGLIYKYKDQNDKALEYYQKALKLASAADDRHQVAILYDNIGGIYREQAQFSKAINYRKRALELFRQLDRKSNMAITLNNIGYIYLTLSMFDRAYEYLRESLDLRLEIGNEALLVRGYGNLARVLSNMGYYDKALIAYKKSLDYVAKMGNPIGESQILANLGNLYHILGDSEKSLEYYREALDLMLRHNITIPSQLSTKYKNIATRLHELGRIDEARANYRKALELRKQSGDVRKLSYSYMDMAQLEMESGRYDSALDYAYRAGEIADSTRIGELIIENSNLMGAIQSRMGNPETALNHFRDAYEESLKLSVNHRLRPLSNLAYTFNRMQSDSALFYGDRVVRIIESTRRNAGVVTGLKSGYFERYSDFYVDLAAWYINYRNDLQRAFELTEASKARALSDDLAEAELNLDEVLPDSIRIEKMRKLERIEELTARFDNTTDPVVRGRIDKQLRKAELDYAAFMNQVQEQNPRYKQVRYPSPMDLSSAQTLCSGNSAILEFSFSKNAVVAFLITEETVRAEILDIQSESGGGAELTRLVETYRDRILAHSPVEQLKGVGRRLTELLIRPFEKELSNHPDLIIVPDGVLAYLPFEALPLEDRFLIEDFNIKYTPSLTAFSLLGRPKYDYEMDLLAIAGSNFNGKLIPAAENGRIDRDRTYPPLPSTIAEVDSIASKFRRTSIYKEGGLSEASVKELLRSNYRYIHLATHGIIDEEHPGLSGLVLSGREQSGLSTREDGLLRSTEIYQLNINADMVVLSACNTGMGKFVKGEGILGLQRSFFYAGVPTVTVSLWNVYDRSTAALMNNFYSALIARKSTGQAGILWADFLKWIGWNRSVPYGDSAPAMREAKLSMLKHPLYHHPIYWAPFIVVGR